MEDSGEIKRNATTKLITTLLFYYSTFLLKTDN